MLFATMAAMSACAPTYEMRGTWIFAPFTPSTIAPIMGPSRSAAGNLKALQPARIDTDNASNASHSSGTGQLPSRDLGGGTAETFGVLIRSQSTPNSPHVPSG